VSCFISPTVSIIPVNIVVFGYICTAKVTIKKAKHNEQRG